MSQRPCTLSLLIECKAKDRLALTSAFYRDMPTKSILWGEKKPERVLALWQELGGTDADTKLTLAEMQQARTRQQLAVLGRAPPELAQSDVKACVPTSKSARLVAAACMLADLEVLLSHTDPKFVSPAYAKAQRERFVCVSGLNARLDERLRRHLCLLPQ